MPNHKELLLSFPNAASSDEQQAIKDQLWDQFGQTGAISIFDMSGFTKVTERFGIIHFLSMVELMRATTQPIVQQHGGHLVKYVADNGFTWFPDAGDAIRAAKACQQAMDKLNAETPDDFDFKLSFGIDHGRFLLFGGTDYFGDPVNKACKLGEDIAEAGEILITTKAMKQLEDADEFSTEECFFEISGVSILAHRLLPGSP